MTRYGFLKGGEVNDPEILDDLEGYLTDLAEALERANHSCDTGRVSPHQARLSVTPKAAMWLSRRRMDGAHNRCGYPAYHTDDKTTLVTMALTTMLGEEKFYGDNTSELLDLAERLCQAGEGSFVAKLAVWARTQGHLRSVSHALMAIVAHECTGERFVRPAVRAIALMRGDDGIELLATHRAFYGDAVKWPHALQRGVRDALSQMGAYDIAKYQARRRELKMRDALRMTHPVPADAETSATMRACIEGTLGMPKGWETELSARGNTAEVWNELLREGRLGYMALLRNLRNIAWCGADIDAALAIIEDPSAVRRARQLPFRYFSAWREMHWLPMMTARINDALDRALEISCENVGHMPGRTAVLIDTSGSMGCRLSERSTVSCRDIAAVFAAIVARASDGAWACRFDSDASQLDFGGTSILDDVKKVPAFGGWTNMEAGFDCLLESGFDADRVIVLSDNEVNGPWSASVETIQARLDEYRQHVGHEVWCHAIDLQGYGTQQFVGPKVNIIGGWSDNVLRFIGLAEAGMGGLVQEIEAMELEGPVVPDRPFEIWRFV